MSRLVAAVILLFSAVSTLAQAPCPAPTHSGAVASTKWSYDINLAEPQRESLRVRLSVEPTSPTLQVQLPVWNALYQVRDFAEHINWLRATDAQGNPVQVRKLDKTTWSVPNASIIEYEIAAIDQGPFGTEFTAQHAFLNLAQVLVYPAGVRDGLVRVQFGGVPESWQVATPMNRYANGFCAESYDRLVDSPVEISDFREFEFEADGATYRVIIDADPGDYDPEAIVKTLRSIVTAEVDWMQDRPFDRYTFIYHFPRQPGRGGMEHAYSTAIETSVERLQQDPLAFAPVSAHEFFHLWNVKRIRPQSLEPIDYTKENYTRALWFSEGITSTVAEHILVRAGLANERTFLERLANQIQTFETRPAKLTQSVEESSLDAWLEKYPYYRLPERSVSYYDKGQIVGVLLDLEIRRVTRGRKSLRDLFQWMNSHYAKQGKFFNDSEGIREAAEAVTGAKFDRFFDRYVSGTEVLPYDEYFATVGLKLDQKVIVASDARFTAAINFSPYPIINSVLPGSEAEKAGVRPGDTVVAVNGSEPSANVVDQISGMRPGSIVRLKLLSRDRTREVKFKLTPRKAVEYYFAELPNLTKEQQLRRAAWVRGDSEASE